ncbi:recombinase family protein [Frankia sp. CiP3]|uniref:recombinase family protein n=1 Tax=Frankia sp. CiP3 TaxID=2880971 RepID=UPI001EF4CE97|nr:recombinase family protein [Frankia sp. CiP3]
MTIKPLAYGFMRVPCNVTDEKLTHMEQRVQAYAEELGFEYATIFQEWQSGSLAAWDELIHELQRADAHHVIVPSFNHVARNGILRTNLMIRLEDDAKAIVHSLKEVERD